MIHVEVIDGKAYLTVAEYAALVGISRSTAYRRLRGTDLCQYVETRDTHVFVDTAAITATSVVQTDVTLAQNDTENETDLFHDGTPGDTPDTSPDVATAAMVEVLREEVSLLRDQLVAKDKEIERLHQLLDQAHQLAAMSQTKELEAPQKRWWRRRNC